MPEDIEKALLSISNIEVLPSKILIYGKENIDKYKEEMVAFSWMKQLPFLHLPKIDILDEMMGVGALAFAGASELPGGDSFSPGDLVIDTDNKPAANQALAKSLEKEEEISDFESDNLAYTGHSEEEISNSRQVSRRDNLGDIDENRVGGGELTLVDKVRSLTVDPLLNFFASSGSSRVS